MAGFEIIRQPEIPTIGIRKTVPMDQMQEFFSDSYGRLFSEIEANHLDVIGAPYGRYRGMPSDTYDVEAGVPIAEPTTSHDEFVASHLPDLEAVEFVHVGPYDTLAQSYQAISAWMSEQNIIPGGEMWEQYLTDPMEEPDPAKWETKIVWPVAHTAQES